MPSWRHSNGMSPIIKQHFETILYLKKFKKSLWPMKLKRIVKVIAACCVLHNICEIHGDGFDESWQSKLDESTYVQPARQRHEEGRMEGPASIRGALLRYFVNNQ